MKILLYSIRVGFGLFGVRDFVLRRLKKSLHNNFMVIFFEEV